MILLYMNKSTDRTRRCANKRARVSREGKSKDYVQHQLLRQAQTVAYMLSDGEGARGVVYVCGDAKHMAAVSLSPIKPITLHISSL